MPDRMLGVWRHFYQWVLLNCWGNLTKCCGLPSLIWTCISSRGVTKHPSCFKHETLGYSLAIWATCSLSESLPTLFKVMGFEMLLCIKHWLICNLPYLIPPIFSFLVLHVNIKWSNILTIISLSRDGRYWQETCANTVISCQSIPGLIK